jgi:Flp pilus assembly protein TadG
MLTLSAGVFEFGNLIQSKLLMEAGLRDGARFAARCNSQMYTENNISPVIDCVAAARNIAVFGNPAGTGTARVRNLEVADVSVAIAEAGSCHDAVSGGVIQYHSVTAQVCIVRASGTLSYDGFGMLSLIGVGSIELSGAQEERLIRF